MRFHKAKPIKKYEAEFIIGHSTTSLNECVVIEHFGQWFDVRRMTATEVEDFVADINRSREADVAAGLLAPH